MNQNEDIDGESGHTEYVGKIGARLGSCVEFKEFVGLEETIKTQPRGIVCESIREVEQVCGQHREDVDDAVGFANISISQLHHVCHHQALLEVTWYTINAIQNCNLLVFFKCRFMTLFVILYKICHGYNRTRRLEQKTVPWVEYNVRRPLPDASKSSVDRRDNGHGCRGFRRCNIDLIMFTMLQIERMSQLGANTSTQFVTMVNRNTWILYFISTHCFSIPLRGASLLKPNNS